MAETPAGLRAQAERLRQMIAEITDMRTRGALVELAADLDRRAARLERWPKGTHG